MYFRSKEMRKADRKIHTYLKKKKKNKAAQISCWLGESSCKLISLIEIDLWNDWEVSIILIHNVWILKAMEKNELSYSKELAFRSRKCVDIIHSFK